MVGARRSWRPLADIVLPAHTDPASPEPAAPEPAGAGPGAHALDDHGGHGGHGDHGGGHAHHTSLGLSNNKLAMWLFLGSECLLFGGLISTYMLYRGRVARGPTPDQ